MLYCIIFDEIFISCYCCGDLSYEEVLQQQKVLETLIENSIIKGEGGLLKRKYNDCILLTGMTGSTYRGAMNIAQQVVADGKIDLRCSQLCFVHLMVKWIQEVPSPTVSNVTYS
jgi:hypothetical protein